MTTGILNSLENIGLLLYYQSLLYKYTIFKMALRDISQDNVLDSDVLTSNSEVMFTNDESGTIVIKVGPKTQVYASCIKIGLVATDHLCALLIFCCLQGGAKSYVHLFMVIVQSGLLVSHPSNNGA